MATAKENSQRINKIETDVAVIKKDISTIKSNHLKHIEDDVKKIDMRLWAILIILVASVFIPFVKNLW
jgi:predicted neutral ceramidase superfamily lipid hydrolase|tara:strand:+ start:353 stop:556 length:204 start_codon:yes stop_codon:yes gene_type:complete